MDNLKLASSSYFGSFSEDEMDIWEYISPERRSLLRLKRLSLRSRLWFKVLSLENRRLIDAVIAVVDRVRSFLLRRILAPLVKRLLGALGGGFSKGELGRREVLKGAFSLMDKAAYRFAGLVAERVSLIAQRWGYREASSWPKDKGFLKFLIIKYLPRNGNVPDLIV